MASRPLLGDARFEFSSDRQHIPCQSRYSHLAPRASHRRHL